MHTNKEKNAKRIIKITDEEKIDKIITVDESISIIIRCQEHLANVRHNSIINTGKFSSIKECINFIK